MMDKLICNRCGKKLSRKTARQIGNEVLCSPCVFPPMKPSRHNAPESLSALVDWHVEKHWQQSFEDIALWDVYITKDGERVDPADFFQPPPEDAPAPLETPAKPL